jgi:ubiquinone/menaquinone biosynthesis C-methylase UbiE
MKKQSDASWILDVVRDVFHHPFQNASPQASLGLTRRAKCSLRHGSTAAAGVLYVCACGEAIPFRPNSVDLIFISIAFHHFTQPQLVAQECARVLREQGRLFLRTGCSDSVSMYPYVPYFPSSRALIEERLPSLLLQESVFNSAALKTVMSGVVTQQIATSYSDYADRLSMKADSILISIDDKEFEAGIRAVRSETAIGPITEPINFLVFEK